MSKLSGYFHDYKFKSLFFRNFMLISLIIIVPFIILSVVFVSSLVNSFNSHAMEIRLAQHKKTQQQTDSRLAEVNMISSKLTLDETVSSFMIFKDVVSDEEISDKLRYVSSTFEYIDSICIASNVTGYTLSIGSATLEQSTIDNLLDGISGEKYLYSYIKNEDYYTNYITLIKPVYITQTIPLGALFINISTYRLEKLMNSSDSSGFTYITNEDGSIICGKNSLYDSCVKSFLSSNAAADSLPHRYSHEGHSYIICSSPASIPGYKYISVSPTDNSFISDNTPTLILVFAVIILLTLLISCLITVQTYTPITHILDVLDQNYSPAIKNKALNIKHQNELSYIIEQLNKLQTDKLKISDDLAAALDKLNKMHYMLMNSQINSHFLSNTLQAISWLAYDLTSAPNKVTDSLKNLGELYRLLTGTDSFLITIEDELEYTKKYLQIMRIKYDNIFTVEYHVDSSCLSAKIPKLTLQPILENSFMHGFDLNSDSNRIEISIFQKRDCVELVIADNGIGIAADELNSLKAALKSDTFTEKIGITNLNNRFKLIFGTEYGISISSELYEGTVVCLTVPDKDTNTVE